MELLPAPTVLEAPDGFLDWEYTAPLTVRVPPYPGMRANDVVTVHWEARGTRYEEPVRVWGTDAGIPLIVRVPNPWLSSASNRVSYSVEPFDGGEVLRSEVYVLNDRGW
ncbi:hypothetical protein ACIBI4_21845 [Streptomyces sp. NPDC050418]|uniref:hypothetical protein n=1 Tax=Streptomyces sp. NPDC050418 TaxID=3365612 RepID=UPI0037A4819E